MAGKSSTCATAAGLPSPTHRARSMCRRIKNSFVTYMGWLVDYARPVYVLLPSVDAGARCWPTCARSRHRLRAGDFRPGGAHPSHAGAARGLRAKLAGRLPQAASSWSMCAAKAEICRKAYRRRPAYPAGLSVRPAGGATQRSHDRHPLRQRTVREIAASLLQAAGFGNVVALNEGAECWSKFLPTENGVMLEAVA